MITDYLKRLKESSGLSNVRIAELSNVSSSTIDRLMSGKAKDPSLELVRRVVFALGGTMEDLESVAPNLSETHGKGPDLPEDMRQVATSADLNMMMDTLVSITREKDAVYAQHTQTRNDMFQRGLEELRAQHTADTAATIANLEQRHRDEIRGLTEAHLREVRSKDRWITLLAIVAMLSMITMMIMVIAAIRNPNIELFGRLA